MAQEIVNRVEQSGLVSLDLGEYYPKESIVTFDIKPWLFQGLLLKEKDFRQHLAAHNWDQYQGKMVNVICSSDAIIPNWAYMLLAVELQKVALDFASDGEEGLITRGYIRNFDKANFQEFEDARVIMKGCGFGPTPPTVFMEATRRLKPLAKTIMFGEPCSTVPVYKKPKK